MTHSFPIYILDDDTILFSKQDLSHSEFWKNEVVHYVATKFKVPVRKLLNIPYCQKRARVVGNRLYCGEKIDKALFVKIQKTLNIELEIVYDDHEKRLNYDVAIFSSQNLQ